MMMQKDVQIFGMTIPQNIRPDTYKAQNCKIWKHNICNPP